MALVHVGIAGCLAAMPLAMAATTGGAAAHGMRAALSIGSQPSTSRPSGGLEGTEWKAVELAGAPVPPTQAPGREAHLAFGAQGRLSGSDGCNRLTGSYVVKDDTLAFGRIASTQMACLDTGDVARRFQDALKGTTRWRIVSGRLELRDAAGQPLAVFERRAQASAPVEPQMLEGTRWQLVKFQGSDGATRTPDDRAKYALEFGTGGRLIARLDCNRGRGTWKATAPSQLELGPLALTRAKCPDGSLYDQFVKQWSFIRSFVIKDRRLHLALMADGGTYEFEPLGASK